MVKVIVKAFGNLYRYLPRNGPSGQVDIPAGSHVKDLVAKLAIPTEEFMFASVNGMRASLDDLLNDQDEVQLFGPVGGG